MKSIIVVLISIFCKAGTLTNYNNKVQYKLVCPDANYQTCFFDINVQVGDYMYVSYDKKDTAIVIVGNSPRDTYIYRTTGNFIFAE